MFVNAPVQNQAKSEKTQCLNFLVCNIFFAVLHVAGPGSGFLNFETRFRTDFRCKYRPLLFFLVGVRCLSSGRTWDSRVDQQDSNHHRQSVSAGKTNAIPTEPSGRLRKYGPPQFKIPATDAVCVKVASSLTFCAHSSLQSFSTSDKMKGPKTGLPGGTTFDPKRVHFWVPSEIYLLCARVQNWTLSILNLVPPWRLVWRPIQYSLEARCWHQATNIPSHIIATTSWQPGPRTREAFTVSPKSLLISGAKNELSGHGEVLLAWVVLHRKSPHWS